SPAAHLFSQARGTLRYEAATARFMPDESPLSIIPAGAANGHFSLGAAVGNGEAAAAIAIERAGLSAARSAISSSAAADERYAIEPIWTVPSSRRSSKSFVDLQNDVTVADIALAAREGYQAAEHLKRYTTLGMGTDQGKTSNLIGAALLAEQLGAPIARVGTTTFRPPYTPVTFGAFPGRACGPHVEPTRYT